VGRWGIWEEALLLFPTQLIASRVSGRLYTVLGVLRNRGCDDLTIVLRLHRKGRKKFKRRKEMRRKKDPLAKLTALYPDDYPKLLPSL